MKKFLLLGMITALTQPANSMNSAGRGFVANDRVADLFKGENLTYSTSYKEAYGKNENRNNITFGMRSGSTETRGKKYHFENKEFYNKDSVKDLIQPDLDKKKEGTIRKNVLPIKKVDERIKTPVEIYRGLLNTKLNAVEERIYENRNEKISAYRSLVDNMSTDINGYMNLADFHSDNQEKKHKMQEEILSELKHFQKIVDSRIDETKFDLKKEDFKKNIGTRIEGISNNFHNTNSARISTEEKIEYYSRFLKRVTEARKALNDYVNCLRNDIKDNDKNPEGFIFNNQIDQINFIEDDFLKKINHLEELIDGKIAENKFKAQKDDFKSYAQKQITLMNKQINSISQEKDLKIQADSYNKILNREIDLVKDLFNEYTARNLRPFSRAQNNELNCMRQGIKAQLKNIEKNVEFKLNEVNKKLGKIIEKEAKEIAKVNPECAADHRNTHELEIKGNKLIRANNKLNKKITNQEIEEAEKRRYNDNKKRINENQKKYKELLKEKNNRITALQKERKGIENLMKQDLSLNEMKNRIEEITQEARKNKTNILTFRHKMKA